MEALFSRLTLADVHRDVMRNIVSVGESQNPFNPFDDLSDQAAEWALARQMQDAVNPPPYRSRTPIIHRPFEDAQWFNAIAWPFTNWQASRFSNGSFGAWYACDSAQATVFESAYHWLRGLLGDAGFDTERVVAERSLYAVRCDAALLDFRGLAGTYPNLLHKTDYTYSQSIGARIHHEGHPGLINPSVRYPGGESFVIFNPLVLANPRHHGQLIYRLEGEQIIVEDQPGAAWLTISRDEI